MRLLILFMLALAVGCSKVPDVPVLDPDIKVNSASFTAASIGFDDVLLQYRYANIGTDGSKAGALVLYLHGGTCRGSDNAAQLDEPGVGMIADYLVNKGMSAVFVVPQCPSGGSWGGRMTGVLRALISACRPSGTPVYIFGGSMGGTGTWSMLSANPGLFAGAMPVAGNPTGCDASAVARTPVLTVMGTEDRLMSIDAVNSFAEEVAVAGGSVTVEIEEGWSHEDVCTMSYTEERLDRVFGR